MINSGKRQCIAFCNSYFYCWMFDAIRRCNDVDCYWCRCPPQILLPSGSTFIISLWISPANFAFEKQSLLDLSRRLAWMFLLYQIEKVAPSRKISQQGVLLAEAQPVISCGKQLSMSRCRSVRPSVRHKSLKRHMSSKVHFQGTL